LIIHAYFEADFRKNYFSANFPSVSVFQCEASGQSPLASGWVRLRRPDGHVTPPDARGLVVCLCGIVHPDWLVIRPDEVPTGLHIAF